MAIRFQRHANVSKQTTLLNGVDFGPLDWRVCGCGLNQFVHEGMNGISNVKVHLKTRSGNVNIFPYSVLVFDCTRFLIFADFPTFTFSHVKYNFSYFHM